MPAIVNSNLAGFTVNYNGVQFGGADAAVLVSGVTFRATPPMYALRGVHRWDESGRSVMGVDYTLQLRCIIFSDTEANEAANMRALRGLLSVPGKVLKIQGLGMGIGVQTLTLGTPAGGVFDLGNGPHPGPPEFTPIGNLAWELSWSVQFFISECVTVNTDQLAFAAFNFTTTWRNDFEGLTQRTISGHVQIPQYRNPNAPKTVLHVAEELRGNTVNASNQTVPRLTISVPPNFQRTENTWRESNDKSRLDFTVVDEQIEGDALPPGITAADGSFNFSTGDAKGGMAAGRATLSMSIKTAPNVHRAYAAKLFFCAAISKQLQLSAMQNGKATVTVVPMSLSIAHGQFARARETQFQMTWTITKDLASILAASSIWTPVSELLSNQQFGLPTQDYTTWKASMDALWGNRGTSGIGSSTSEAVIIDLCDNVTYKTIGEVGSPPNDLTASTLPSLACPTIPDNGGWYYWNLSPQIYRRDQHSLHRKAVLYQPSVVTISDPLSSTRSPLGSPEIGGSESDRHAIEYHGQPEVLVGMSFVGYRFKHMPFLPRIKSVGGFTAYEVSTTGGDVKKVFDALGCPLYCVRGTRVYRVVGDIRSIKAVFGPTSGVLVDDEALTDLEL